MAAARDEFDKFRCEMEMARQNEQQPARSAGTSQSIDWYAEGESRVVEVNGTCVEVRFVARKGRRGRIAIKAPPGAVFRSLPNG